MARGESHKVGEGLRVFLPTGQTLELYTEMEYVGNELGTFNPHAVIRDPRGLTVPRLDHMLIAGEDPALTERMFTECLDFHVSERLITDIESNDLVATWLFAGQTSHDIALIKVDETDAFDAAKNLGGLQQSAAARIRQVHLCQVAGEDQGRHQPPE